MDIKVRRHSVWDQEVLYASGDEYFSTLLAAIANATSTIEFETYIFEKGILADRMIKALTAAAQRGVRVRVIVDGWGSPGFVWDYYPQLEKAGVHVRFFRVTPWILRRLPGDPRRFLHRMFVRLRQVNSGNHRKYCLIDHTDLWVGSFNVSDVHLAEVHGSEAWKDMGVRVRGYEVRFARRAFQRAYQGWKAFNIPGRTPRLLLLNDSILHKRRTRLEQLARMRKAEQRIWLATPYFVPVGRLLRTLSRRARGGLDVRLMVPEKNDIWFMKWISYPILGSLAKKGVKIFIYSPKFSHQKVFINDEWICIGSTNLNHRSFMHDLEMDVVITHEDNRKKIVESYIKDQSMSRVFDSGDWARLPWWKRILSSMFILARYWS